MLKPIDFFLAPLFAGAAAFVSALAAESAVAAGFAETFLSVDFVVSVCAKALSVNAMQMTNRDILLLDRIETSFGMGVLFLF